MRPVSMITAGGTSTKKLHPAPSFKGQSARECLPAGHLATRTLKRHCLSFDQGGIRGTNTTSKLIVMICDTSSVVVVTDAHRMFGVSPIVS